MALLVENEARRLAAESRVRLYQSEKRARNKILAYRDRIEARARKAERKLLRELQALVRTQEQVIQQYEDSCIGRMDTDAADVRQTIQDYMTLQSAVVTFRANGRFDPLLQTTMTFGDLKLESLNSDSGLFDILTKDDYRLSSSSVGYIQGRNIVPTVCSDSSNEGMCDRPTAHQYEDYMYADIYNWFAGVPQGSRRRGNNCRKHATVLLKGMKTSDVGSEDQHLTNNDESLITNEMHQTDKRSDNQTPLSPPNSCNPIYANVDAHKQSYLQTRGDYLVEQFNFKLNTNEVDTDLTIQNKSNDVQQETNSNLNEVSNIHRNITCTNCGSPHPKDQEVTTSSYKISNKICNHGTGDEPKSDSNICDNSPHTMIFKRVKATTIKKLKRQGKTNNPPEDKHKLPFTGLECSGVGILPDGKFIFASEKNDITVMDHNLKLLSKLPLPCPKSVCAINEDFVAVASVLPLHDEIVFLKVYENQLQRKYKTSLPRKCKYRAMCFSEGHLYVGCANDHIHVYTDKAVVLDIKCLGLSLYDFKTVQCDGISGTICMINDKGNVLLKHLDGGDLVSHAVGATAMVAACGRYYILSDGGSKVCQLDPSNAEVLTEIVNSDSIDAKDICISPDGRTMCLLGNNGHEWFITKYAIADTIINTRGAIKMRSAETNIESYASD